MVPELINPDVFVENMQLQTNKSTVDIGMDGHISAPLTLATVRKGVHALSEALYSLCLSVIIKASFDEACAGLSISFLKL